MSKSPSTDALDASLRGDWQRCYEMMHVHAVKLEMALADAANEARQSREELIREKAVADAFRATLKDNRLGETVGCAVPFECTSHGWHSRIGPCPACAPNTSSAL